MRYRPPLELELAILELAAPPLVKPRLVDRVDFFINVSLVHRSLTAWAQERLHDQFLYTYRPREDEYARLERRLTEAGFGPSRPIKPLYLNVTRLRLEEDPEPHYPDVQQSSETAETADTASSTNESSQSLDGRSNLPSDGHGIFVLHEDPDASGWTLSPLLARCVQSLDTLWLLPPFSGLDLSDHPLPVLLEVDDNAFSDDSWYHLPTLPLSHRTTLLLLCANLYEDPEIGPCPVLNLVLARSGMQSLGDIHSVFPDFEVLIMCESDENARPLFEHGGQPVFDLLPTSLRHIHLLQRSYQNREGTPADTGESGNPAAHVPDPLPGLRRIVEASVIAPRCTFKYLRSTATEEDALVDAMADLVTRHVAFLRL